MSRPEAVRIRAKQTAKSKDLKLKVFSRISCRARKGRKAMNKDRVARGEPVGDQVTEFRNWILEIRGILAARPEVHKIVISPKRAAETASEVEKMSS